MFAARLPDRLATNEFSHALARLRADRVRLLDLTQTNPTAVRLPFPSGVLSALSDERSNAYRPDPLGVPEARAAIAAATGADARRLVLAASTSEAYSMLFKLLCDPGDHVLVPQPSYPLFDLLSRLDAVRPRPFRLEYHGVWSIDRASLESAITADTRAVLIVSPNNPTGSLLRRDDREWLAELCAERGLAIIADEVFADYPLRPRADGCSIAGETRALTFALGGLSKSAGLPQVKLGWIAASGPEALVADALARLEMICDTYLSVSTPVQVAAARLIDAGVARREMIRARLAANLTTLESALHAHPAVTLCAPEGGWSVVLHVPAREPEDAMAMRLLTDAHVVVHPGYFYDFEQEAFLVMSLLPEPGEFAEAVDRLLRSVA